MPLNTNLGGNHSGLSLLVPVRSVTAWLYTTSGVAYDDDGPLPGAPSEVAPADAHFVIFQAWTQTNQRGTNLGCGSLDTGSESTLAYWKATDIDTLLLNAFGA